MSGFKANVTKQYNKGFLSESERQEKNKRIDNARVTLNEYIKHYDTKLNTIKGSGIKGRGRRQRGGNVVFFNDPKQLLKKLELIVGEVLAGNASINSSGAHPPPGQPQGICLRCQSRGLGISIPRGDPQGI